MQISIKYTGKLEDYYEAEKYFRKKKKTYKIDKIFEILLIILGIYMIFMKNHILGGIFIILGTIFFTGLSEKFVTKIYFTKYIKKRGFQELIFSDEKIIYALNDIKSEMKWDFYNGYIETPNTFLLLYHERKHYSVLPKESFSGNSLEEFRKLLKQKFN